MVYKHTSRRSMIQICNLHLKILQPSLHYFIGNDNILRGNFFLCIKMFNVQEYVRACIYQPLYLALLKLLKSVVIVYIDKGVCCVFVGLMLSPHYLWHLVTSSMFYRPVVDWKNIIVHYISTKHLFLKWWLSVFPNFCQTFRSKVCHKLFLRVCGMYTL